jgi:hypothetical protein
MEMRSGFVAELSEDIRRGLPAFVVQIWLMILLVVLLVAEMSIFAL